MKHLISELREGVEVIRYLDPTVGHVSYLLFDRETATAAIVDPAGDVDSYLEDAWRLGGRIRHLFQTGLKDDFTSGVLELQDRTQATIYRGAWAGSSASVLPLKNEDRLEFGRVGLRILETPGHTIEGIVLLAYDTRSPSRAPYAAFTGETLLLGDFGRPDPRPEDGYSARQLAGMLYDSLREKLLTLPGRVRLFPAHAGRSDAPEAEPKTLLGQRFENPAFQELTREEFMRRTTWGMIEHPDYGLGVGRRPRPCSAQEFLEAQRGGAQVIDDRDPACFASGHLQGSLNLPFAAEFEPWAAAAFDRKRPVVVLCRPGREGATAERLTRMGAAFPEGYLEGGIEALRGHPEKLRRGTRLPYRALVPRLLSGAAVLVLDTRPPGRRPLGPCVSGLPVPLEQLRMGVCRLPRKPELVVCDDSPYRSSAAASLLRQRGFASVAEVAGGLALWAGPASLRKVP